MKSDIVYVNFYSPIFKNLRYFHEYFFCLTKTHENSAVTKKKKDNKYFLALFLYLRLKIFILFCKHFTSLWPEEKDKMTMNKHNESFNLKTKKVYLRIKSQLKNKNNCLRQKNKTHKKGRKTNRNSLTKE